MPTAADLIGTTKRHIYGSDRQQLNSLKADIDGDDIVLSLVWPNVAIKAGASVAVGLEVMYVWATDSAAETITVGRGWNGSPQSAHSAGDIVTVNPRFSDWDVLTALNDDLLDLSSPLNGLYAIRTVDLEAVSGRLAYDLPMIDYQSIADIRWQVPNTQTQEWRQITDFDVNQDLPLTAFPSGTALFINGPQPVPQQTIRVRYRSQLGQLGNLTDDVAEVTGLPVTAMGLPPLGAALRIMAGRPISRANTTSQGDTRRAAEVTVNDVVQAPASLNRVRMLRLAAEASRLQQLWPPQTRSRDLMGPGRLR